MINASSSGSKNTFEEILAGEKLKFSYTEDEFLKDTARIIAFYLPQFHEVRENSEWWGNGFTDWVNVAKARPHFEGHYQPHIPRDLGFYDASLETTLEAQVTLAKDYDVYGFCFYWYWFDGKRMLSKPIDALFNSQINFPYCFCWANDSWARTWDHNPKEMLIEQSYGEGWEKRLVTDFTKYWSDERYIKVDNRPLLLIYRAKQIPDYAISIQKIRDLSQVLLGTNPYILVVDFYDVSSASEFGADGLVEFPPHKFWHESNQNDYPEDIQNNFIGKIISYKKIVIQSAKRNIPKNEKIYRTVMPSWDNTARLGNRSIIIQNTNPHFFKVWLDSVRQYTRENRTTSENFIFVNAWNEWAEGAHLEPDLKIGNGFLNQVKKSIYYQPNFDYLSGKYLHDCLELMPDNVDRNVFFSSSYYAPPSSLKMRFASKVQRISPKLYKLMRRLYRATLR